MEKTALKTIENHQLLNFGDGVVIGLSGGADSTALLLLLATLKERFNLRIHAVHVNHLFRGEEALRDEAFSSALCEANGIPITIVRINVAEIAEHSGISFELAGRDVRYEQFEIVRRELGYQKIAVAHHRDDQGETLLLRLIRGSGLEGLAGMRPNRDNVVIRPLLETSRKQIEAYCKEKGVQPMVDHTNQDSGYSRNFIRNEIIPQIDARFQVSFGQQLSKTAQRLAEDSDYIQSQLIVLWESLVQEEDHGFKVNRTVLEQTHPAMQSRLIRKMYGELKGNLLDFEEVHVEQVTGLLKGSGFKSFAFKGVRFKSEHGSLTAELEHETSAPKKEMPILSVEAVKEINSMGMKENGVIYVDQESIVGTLRLRHRKPGDVFIPMGMIGRKKIKDFFIDEKIPMEMRDAIWLLCDDEKIVWVCGYRQSEETRVTKKTRQILRLMLSDVVTHSQM